MKSGWNERFMWRLLVACAILFLIAQSLSITFTLIQMFRDDWLIAYLQSLLSK